MIVRQRGLAALVLGSVLALPAFSQSLRPGLWEATSDMSWAGEEVQAAWVASQKRYAEMSPAQRKAALPAGTEMSIGADGVMRFKACLTPETAALFTLSKTDPDCTSQRSEGHDDTMTIAFACSIPGFRGAGLLTFEGDTGYHMRMKFTREVKGEQNTIALDTTSNWLGTDCGDVKPMARPTTKFPFLSP